MTRDQRMLYEQAKVELLNADDLDDWSPIRIFRLYTALQTILCGYWKDMQGRIHTCSHNRLDLLMTTLAGIPRDEPVIVWAKLRRAVDDITQALQAEYGSESVAHYHGGLSTTQRDAELMRWRASAQTGARFLVAIQDAGSRGLTLNEAAYSVFYADSFKYSQRLQAEDRNHRIGQTRRPVYISLRCLRSIDERIQSALERKGSVLTEFREMVQQVRTLGTKDRVTAMLGAL
jgi:SNF2 family DNA or RNA helicase